MQILPDKINKNVVQTVLNKVETNDIIVKNELYPTGLYEQTIKNYYKTNKHSILNELDNRPVLLFLFPSTNNFVVKRNVQGSIIKLDTSNFDKMINGRTLSISVEQPELQYWLLDIDCPNGTSEIEKKKCVKKMINFLKNEKKYIRSVRISNSSTGYHIYGYLKLPSEWPAEIVKFLENKLSIFSDSYYINKKGRTDKINIDLSSMTRRGSHTLIGSLNLNGTICKDITNSWESFRRNDPNFLLS